MKKTVLYLGLNDKDSKKQLIRTNKAVKIVYDLLLNTYELAGATVQVGNGIYKHENGSIVTEKTLIIILFGVEETVINNIIVHLKHVFNQESVLREVSNVDYAFM